MNTLFAALALTLAQTPQTPDLAKSVSFNHLAAPAKKVVADLAAQTGLKLEVAATTAADVLFVQADGVPTKDLLDRIAQAVNGEWATESDGTMRLVRPSATLNRELQAERQERLVSLQKELKQFYDALTKKPAAKPKKPPTGDDEEEFDEAEYRRAQAEESRHILTLIQRINLNDLVLPDEDSRVVFSSNPTPMQKLLPGVLEPIVAELVKKHNEEVAAKKSLPDDDDADDEEMRKYLELARQYGANREKKPIEGVPSKLLLIAEQQALFGGLTISIRLYDAKGKVAVEDSLMLGMGEFMEDAMAIAGDKPKAAPAGDDPPIEYSAESKELNQLFKSFMTNPNRGKMSPALEAKLLRPDIYDPLGFGLSDSLASVAKAKKTNVVALIPDDSNSILEMFTEGAATVNRFLQELEDSDEFKISKLSNWMVFQPKRPVESRRKRTDRVALAKLIGAARAKGIANLDDIAAYALTSPSPYESGSATPYLMLFAPNAMQQGMMGIADWNAVRFYGTLNISQRQALADQGRIPLGNMLPQQHAILTRLLFGARADLRIQDPNAKPKEEFGFMEMIRMAMPGQDGGEDFRQEPTEIMPTGLPMAGYLTGALRKEPIGKSDGTDPMLMFGALGADELAMLKYFKEDARMSAMTGMMPNIDRLRLGERTNIEMKIYVAPDVALERQLQDNRIDPNGSVVSMDSLPADFRARIDKRLEAFKKSPLAGLGMMGSQRVKPPSPKPN